MVRTTPSPRSLPVGSRTIKNLSQPSSRKPLHSGTRPHRIRRQTREEGPRTRDEGGVAGRRKEEGGKIGGGNKQERGATRNPVHSGSEQGGGKREEGGERRKGMKGEDEEAGGDRREDRGERSHEGGGSHGPDRREPPPTTHPCYTRRTGHVSLAVCHACFTCRLPQRSHTHRRWPNTTKGRIVLAERAANSIHAFIQSCGCMRLFGQQRPTIETIPNYNRKSYSHKRGQGLHKQGRRLTNRMIGLLPQLRESDGTRMGTPRKSRGSWR